MPFDISMEHDLKKLRRQLGVLETKAVPQRVLWVIWCLTLSK
jgi:hypothetical protein